MGVRRGRAALCTLALLAFIGARGVAPRAPSVLLATGSPRAALQPQPSSAPILILVSFDGFRWDYGDRYAAPNLRALGARGVRATEMIPSFPVLTFPNHYTIVTGLYPAHHGVVANAMLDPSTPVRFSMSNADAVRDAFWWGGEPMWVTAVKGGRRAAAMFWPGTEAEIGGVRPTYFKAFDGKLPAAARTAQVIQWLGLPEAERPSFVTLYYDDVDHAGHDYGPDSPELERAVAIVDRELGVLTSAIERLQLADRTTLVVVSDHGMAALSESRVILLDDYLDTNAVDLVESGGFLALAPRNGASADAIYRRLHDAHPHLRVYTAATMPDRFHYTNSPRIAPIIGVPDAGWSVTSRAARQRRQNEGRRSPQAGTHGFDPADRIMHAIFAAAGPAVRRGVVVEPFENIHVYNFLCAVLGVEPAPNDGDPARVSAWLQRWP